MKNYIANNILYLVKKNNCTQDEFGALFDLSRGLISQYAKEKSQPKIETIQKICSHFKLSIDDFINLDLSKSEHSNNQTAILVNEPRTDYLSKDAIIEAQKETIDVQRMLIENLRSQLSNAS